MALREFRRHFVFDCGCRDVCCWSSQWGAAGARMVINHSLFQGLVVFGPATIKYGCPVFVFGLGFQEILCTFIKETELEPGSREKLLKKWLVTSIFVCAVLMLSSCRDGISQTTPTATL